MFRSFSFKAVAQRHKTLSLTAAVITTNVLGNVLLGHGMHQNGPVLSASPLAFVHALLNPWVLAGVAILSSWMLLDLALLSCADLTFVLPTTASAYVLIAVAGHFWFGEQASTLRWIGVATITLGAALAGETPPKTTEESPEERTPEDELSC